MPPEDFDAWINGRSVVGTPGATATGNPTLRTRTPGLSMRSGIGGSGPSALAAPGTFIWWRLMDAALSMNDRHALDIHARVERWALDEVALPGKLVHQIVDWLYREDRFCRGALTVRKTLLGPLSLPVPTLAVVNVADEVAPVASVAPFTDAMPTGYASIIEYPGEVGTGVQHLGILVGREAHARVWPQIISWLNMHS
jgi:poly[(R)-3-hydroxyalkanoate] polymerase subunit PhaC